MTDRVRRPLALFACLFATQACAYRPARFLDAPAVTVVADDAPTGEPEPRAIVQAFYLSDVYVRRTLVDALDPQRHPDAGDVNSLDEVPRSSWFEPPAGAAAPEPDPPVPPLEVLPGAPPSGLDGLYVADRRGVRYELRLDDADRPEMRTAAAAIASRLYRAVGYLTAEVTVVDVREADLRPPSAEADRRRFEQTLAGGPRVGSGPLRFSATRWPVGADYGPTSDSGVRYDDPNDRVPHRDRRTLRALKVFGSWLGNSRFNHQNLRDAYEGPKGKGHLRHYLLGLEGALGTRAVIRRQPDDDDHLHFFIRLFTLGLVPKKRVTLTQRRWLAIGEYDERVTPEKLSMSPPFEPIDRILASDGYWAAKRAMAVPLETIVRAVDAGRISEPEARARLVQVIALRQRAVAAYWFDQVTPCEVTGLDKRALYLRDEAVAAGFAELSSSRYVVQILDDEANRLAPDEVVVPASASFAVTVPAGALAMRDYVVVRVRAERSGKRAPRWLEVHLWSGAAGPRVVGIRH